MVGEVVVGGESVVVPVVGVDEVGVRGLAAAAGLLAGLVLHAEVPSQVFGFLVPVGFHGEHDFGLRVGEDPRDAGCPCRDLAGGVGSIGRQPSGWPGSSVWPCSVITGTVAWTVPRMPVPRMPVPIPVVVMP